MKLIPLTKGLFAQIDDDDFEYLSQWRWRASGGYAIATMSGQRVRMHRVILNPEEGSVVDHIDMDKLNNQRMNLRVCTNAENLRNRGKTRIAKTPGKVSKYKGVYLVVYGGKTMFSASIKTDYITRYLGCFDTEDAAAIAYNRASAVLHREFAYQNPVEDSGGPLKGFSPDVHVKKIKFRGVTMSPSGRIRAHISGGGKTKFLGYFKTEEEAARRWDEEARLLGRPEHKMNFPKQN